MEILQKIDLSLKTRDYSDALKHCNESELTDPTRSLYLLLFKIMNEKKLISTNEFLTHIFRSEEQSVVPTTPPIRVKLLCNWCTSEQLCNLWNKMSKGNYRWNNIQITWEDKPVPDYYVIINCPPLTVPPPQKKTIVFQMEPNMSEHPEMWGEWSKLKKEDFLFVGDHATTYNNNEWHLSKTYSQLIRESVVKDESRKTVVSTVLSGKYKDIGQIKRVDFVKFLDTKNDLDVHVYGDNRWDYKNYKGSLPSHCKDNGLFPYKYTFNAENHKIKNYYTEKIIDAILSECLCFYSGAINIDDLIDPRAYVRLELCNFEEEYKTIKRAIDEDWWSQRIAIIKSEKQRILNDLQFFPRLEKIILSVKN